MTKNEMIRFIYDALMEHGYEDKELGEYVKKIHTPVENVFSVHISSDDDTFEEACDADVRVVFYDTVTGPRTVCAHECMYGALEHVYRYLNENFEINF